MRGGVAGPWLQVTEPLVGQPASEASEFPGPSPAARTCMSTSPGMTHRTSK